MEQVFNEQLRKVFPYFNGAAQVWGDPLAIYRALMKEFDGDTTPVLEAFRSRAQIPAGTPPEEAAAAMAAGEACWTAAAGRLVEFVRKAFAMVPFDPATGCGATEEDCLAALEAYHAWMATKKAPAAS